MKNLCISQQIRNADPTLRLTALLMAAFTLIVLFTTA